MECAASRLLAASPRGVYRGTARGTAGKETLSRIWDALKKAQQQKDAREASQRGGRGKSTRDRRRSQRLTLDVPLFVYGHTAAEDPFYEETKTVQVSAHGGLLLLASKVRPGQKLLLTNKLTQREVECRVVHLGPAHRHKTDVGVAFARPAPDFWHIMP